MKTIFVFCVLLFVWLTFSKETDLVENESEQEEHPSDELSNSDSENIINTILGLSVDAKRIDIPQFHKKYGVDVDAAVDTSSNSRRNLLRPTGKHGPPQDTFFVDYDSYTSNPYLYVGKHMVTTSLGYLECSGVIVGIDRYLTNAHCILDGDGHVYSDIKFVPRFRSGVSSTFWFPPPDHVYEKTKVAFFVNYRAFEDETLDIAIVQVGGNIMPNNPDPLGFMGVPKISNGTEECTSTDGVRLIGYPTAPSPPYEGKEMVETNSSIWFESSHWGVGEPENTRGMFVVPSDQSSGSSGAGLFNATNGVLCGIVVGRFDYFNFDIVPIFDDRINELLNHPMEGGNGHRYEV